MCQLLTAPSSSPLAFQNNLSNDWFNYLGLVAPEAFLNTKVLELHDYLWFWPRRFLPPSFTKLDDVGANRYLMPLMRFRNFKTLRFIVPPPCRTLDNISHDEQQFAMEQLMRFLRAKQIFFGGDIPVLVSERA